jgi:hypothetical protein
MPSRGQPPSPDIARLLDLLDAWEQGKDFEPEDSAAGADIEAQDIVDPQFGIEDAPLQGPVSDEDMSVIEQPEAARDQSFYEDVREPYRPAAEAQDIVDPQFGIEDAPLQGPASDEDMSVIEQPQAARDQSLFEDVREPYRPAADTAENRFASHIVRGMWKIKNQ